MQDTFALARAAEAEPHPPDCHTTVNDGHGRIEIRHCRAIGDSEILAYVSVQSPWPDLRRLIEVESIRRIGIQRTIQTRYFISRGPPDAPALRAADGGPQCGGVLRARELPALGV